MQSWLNFCIAIIRVIRSQHFKEIILMMPTYFMMYKLNNWSGYFQMRAWNFNKINMYTPRIYLHTKYIASPWKISWSFNIVLQITRYCVKKFYPVFKFTLNCASTLITFFFKCQIQIIRKMALLDFCLRKRDNINNIKTNDNIM